MPRKSRTDEEMRAHMLTKRGFTKEGCWYWMGSMSDSGYGNVTFQAQQWRVHRLAFKLFKPDEYREGAMILHKNECSSTRRFNPDHLYAGNNSDNQQDAVVANRHNETRKTHCPQGHEYSEENTYIQPSNGSRLCRICMKTHNDIQNNLRDYLKAVIK